MEIDNLNIENLVIELLEIRDIQSIIFDLSFALNNSYHNDSDTAFKYAYQHTFPQIELLNELIDDKIIDILEKNKLEQKS